MGSTFSSIKFCFSTFLDAIERTSVCTLCAILTFCLCFTVLMVLSVGIGIGYHYCFVQSAAKAIEQANKTPPVTPATTMQTVARLRKAIQTTSKMPIIYRPLYTNTSKSL